MSYDVIVVGGGAAGSVAAAVLAKEGKRVLLLERDAGLAGRARYFEHDGYKLQWGPHILEDPGSGLGAIMSHLGHELVHGPSNDGLAMWTDEGWKAAGEVYGGARAELKKVITEIADVDLDKIDDYDQVSFGKWLSDRTSHEGVISLFEFLAVLEGQTGSSDDHSASDNLFMRALHLREQRKPGYSYIPEGGFEELFETIGALAEERGAEVRRNVQVASVAIEDRRVRGVFVEVGERRTPNEILPVERIDADAVILTVPAWQVLDLIPQGSIPGWYHELIERMTTLDARGTWIGFYAGLTDPAYQYTPRELGAFGATPRTGLPGFAYLHSEIDAGTAPEGEFLFVCGVACDLTDVTDRMKQEEMMKRLEDDMDEMYPAMRSAKWKSRHVITNFGLKARPGLVGAMRPHNVVPGVEGLFLGGDTYRARSVGIDRAARTGLTCAELILGQRIAGLDGTWRY